MPRLSIVTNKRVCFWGAPASVPKSTLPTTECLERTSANTGNLFIGAGLFEATRAPYKDYWDHLGTPEEFDERFDVLFVPASNFIFEYTDLTPEFEFFNRTKCQIFMFGLGSQLRDPNVVRIPSGTKAFLSLAAERGHSIGVRGAVTADVMRRLGYRNVVVTGCPSTLNLPSVGAAVRFRSIRDLTIAGNFTNNAYEHAIAPERMQALESALFDELVELDGYYVLQNELHESFLMSRLSQEGSLSDEDIWHLRRVQELFCTSRSEEDLLSFMRWNTRMFFSVKHWLRFMRQVDLSFGTRFHGNVAAMLAGKPAFVLCHDFRTLELAEFYKFPHHVIDGRTPIPSIEWIASEANMDAFYRNVPALFDGWTAFVRANGFDAIVA